MAAKFYFFNAVLTHCYFQKKKKLADKLTAVGGFTLVKFQWCDTAVSLWTKWRFRALFKQLHYNNKIICFFQF